jgi:hypothetical protein
MKQDRIIPVFSGAREQNHCVSTQWELTSARHWKLGDAVSKWQGHKVVLGRQTIQVGIGAIVTHSGFLSGNMDDDSTCNQA